MSNEKEIREAYEEIKKLVDSAVKKIAKAQVIANKHEISFCYNFGYGLHGIYKGYNLKIEETVNTSDWVGSMECPDYDDSVQSRNDQDDEIPF